MLVLLLGYVAACAQEPATSGPADVPDAADPARPSAPSTGVAGAMAGEGGARSAAGAGVSAEPAAGRKAIEPGPPDAGTRDGAVREPTRVPQALALTGSLAVHDPAIIEAAGSYYVFSTGSRVPVRRSSDLLRWEEAGTAFSDTPAWMAKSGIAFDPNNSMWAPEVAFFGGVYHLYYSVSSFGMNDSCIGHATATELADIRFTDRGSMLCSKGKDYNAIDPNVVLDEEGVPWLAFGSFWTGIKLTRLTDEGVPVGDAIIALAGGRPGPNAIEAPAIVRRGSEYYLFVSLDSCCQGTSSTYKLAVGRASNVRGPYRDEQGKLLLEGGGSVLLRGSEGDLDDAIAFAALGHNSVLLRGDDAFNVYHAYRESDGAAVLRIAELIWDDTGWPLSGGP